MMEINPCLLQVSLHFNLNHSKHFEEKLSFYKDKIFKNHIKDCLLAASGPINNIVIAVRDPKLVPPTLNTSERYSLEIADKTIKIDADT